jgi:[ribosomal protein S5]-alanine N-acetyltransferase
METPRLRIVSATPQLASSMARYVERNEERFGAVMPLSADAYSVEHWSERLHAQEREMQRGRALHLVGLQKRPGAQAVVCDVNFTNIVRGVFQACFLGFKIDAEHEGKGLMFEVLETAIPRVFDELRLHRIMANYQPDNERSARLLRKLRFTVEGYAKDYLYLGGRWRDHVLSARLNESFGFDSA